MQAHQPFAEKEKPCSCVGVEFGSYDNQVTVDIPEHMKEHRRRHGLTVMLISLDRCISEEVESLWALGITTNGCCCGHGKAAPYIGVDLSDAPKMEALGYEHKMDCPFPENHFKSKRVSWAAGK